MTIARCTDEGALRPPADPCMCGDFSTWHGACYLGLSRKEIIRRHKHFITEWHARARAQALGHVKKVCGW